MLDLTDLNENLLWEVEKCRDTGALRPVVAVVHESQARDFLEAFSAPSKGPGALHVHGKRLDDAGAFRAALLGALSGQGEPE